MISVLNRFFKSHFLARHALLALAGFIIPSMAAAEWTYLPLPYALRNSTIVTTGNVRARCSGVGVSSDGSRYCERSFAPPTFANENEVVETVPAGRTLKLLEVHYDQDGFALRVVGDNEPFWIFQPHQGPSVVSSEGQPIEIPLQNIYTAYLAGDIAAILGHQDVQLQCLPGMTVIDQPLPEVVQERPTPAPTPAPTGLQVPEFDFHAASAGNKFSPNCQAFIGASGEYGEWGRIIENELKNSDHLSIFLSDQAGQVRNMDRICPNFTRLSREQKIRFWVWAFMSIAQVESTCQSGLQASEPSSNGYFAQGLLQMENLDESLDGNRSIWAANPNPQRACMSPNIRENAGDNLRCGLDAMANVLKGYHSCAKQEFVGQPPVITEENCVPDILNNKWEKFVCLPEQVAVHPNCRDDRPGRGHKDAVIQRIRTFQLCGATQ